MTDSTIQTATTDTTPANLVELGVAEQLTAVELILAHSWFAIDGQPVAPPAWLHQVAARLVADCGPIPGLDTVAGLHRWLVGFADDTDSAADAAHATADRAQQELDDFHADVRRRAAHAVADGQICLSGTNRTLDQFGVDELTEQYRVNLLVPVAVTVYARDEDDAYEQAEEAVRDDLVGSVVDIYTSGMRHDGAEANGSLNPDDLD
ncbi:hypothetical protein [Phytohabitans rumicis]|uniref:Uncharacterized protein n=1 Tax=Phytohabitans rumicis TaxID=1076125 RepID=A0A6V8LFD3_9ACTN|nr:hypothetical protein [Phytohabitans rumicis]GFJ93329.1 hypothetical protein Prum_069710 [Phytohabitans rumicis]